MLKIIAHISCMLGLSGGTYLLTIMENLNIQTRPKPWGNGESKLGGGSGFA